MEGSDAHGWVIRMTAFSGLLGLIGIALVLSAQSSDVTRAYLTGHVSGAVDEEFADSVEAGLRLRSAITISSGGGNASSGWRAGKAIFQRNADLILDGDCLSACAEFLLPSARSIKTNSPILIGFHGNDFIFDKINSDLFPGQNFVNRQRLNWIREVYRSRVLNEDFYKETMSRLDIKYVGIGNQEPRQLEIYSANSMWFPTSRQLHDLLGLEIEGPLCADDRSCWEPKILEIADGQEKFVVGDLLVSVESDGTLATTPWVITTNQIRALPSN